MEQLKLILGISILLVSSIAQRYTWVRPDDLNIGLPSSVSIYTLNMTQSPTGLPLTGAFARFDMTDNNLQFLVRDQNQDQYGYFPKTPEQYAKAEQNVVYAVLNGGYFNMKQNISASFVAENGQILNKNSINQNAKNHPTVGAFGLTTEGNFETEYIYSYGQQLDTYKFRYPNICPGPQPNKDEGIQWKVKQGIGAGPVLVKNSQIIDGNPQNFDYKGMIDFRHPRSAVCVDDQSRLYFVAMDGRYDGSGGLKMPQIADVMVNLGCTHALNLDGGGSTLLYANGRNINRPSDPTGPRPVVTAILVRDRFKKKIDEHPELVSE